MDWAVIAALTKIDADTQEHLAATTSAQVRAAYSAINWYDHAAITVAARSAGEVVRAAAQTSVGYTSAYLTRVLREMTGSAPTSSTLLLTQPLRTGVASWATCYGRVADTVRFEVSKGKTLEDATRIGLDRADVMARTDLGMARRLQARETLQASARAVGYRRVVHPELSRTGSCGLCVVAADRRYHRGDLLPLHARCRCTVLPITADHDPGGAFDLDPVFRDAYRISLSTKAEDLKDVRVRVEQHDELGPVLLKAEHRSTNPGKNRRAREREALAGASQPVAKARPVGAGAFDALSREQLELQVRITAGLKDSEWRTRQLARLQARLTEIG